MTKSKFKAWYQASRAPFFVATLIPLILGGVLASQDGYWHIGRWLAVLLASFLVHLNTNLANDYFEYFSGADDGDSVGGSRVLQEGLITLKQIKYVMIVFYIGALILGLYILLASSALWLIAAMLVAFFSSLFYTAPPIKYGYHGLGELFVGINMGPIMVAGTYTALSGDYSLQSLIVSLPIGVMVAMILFYQSLPDIITDKKVNKITLAVRLGRDKAIWGIRFFALLAVGTIIALYLLGLIHIVGLASLATLAIIVRIDQMIRSTKNWVDLHGRGGKVRIFYLINGLILIFGILLN